MQDTVEHHTEAAPALPCCRGFVRERPASQARSMLAASSAAKGRPLGASIIVNGINKTMSASSTFGDFYRCGAGGLGSQTKWTHCGLHAQQPVVESIPRVSSPSHERRRTALRSWV